MPCISFIVPVYNMERLLPRALRSLRAQTLTDFEAILINDGSKDGSAALCAQAVAEDARFRFIDQPNGGVAAARNAGLNAARGEYIFFLDPDDWVEPDAAEVLYHAARNADADCVEFGLYLDSYDENDRLLHTQTSGSTLSPPDAPGGSCWTGCPAGQRCSGTAAFPAPPDSRDFDDKRLQRTARPPPADGRRNAADAAPETPGGTAYW